MRRYAIYSFVITLLWLGFICAISFMEAPIKFRAPGVELKHALSIGRLVFDSLNRVEWVCCVFSWVLIWRLKIVRTRGSVLLLGLITAILIFQTWVLLPPMDVRALQILAGETVPSTWHHSTYIGVEIAKAILLAVLTSTQVQSFAQAVISE